MLEPPPSDGVGRERDPPISVTVSPESSLGRLLESRGRARELGHVIVSLEEIGSTNDYASSLAKRGAPHGTVVTAQRQSAGRGRWRRSWESSSGGLYLTLILREENPPAMPLLPLLASVAGAEAIHECSAVSVVIHWPNDLLVEGKKVGGVLCEAVFLGERLDFALVGIGINVNQEPADFSPSLAPRATSLKVVSGSGQDGALLAACLIESMERWWAEAIRSPGRARERWTELAEGAQGARVRVHPKGEGTFLAVTAGLGDDGSLKVRSLDGEERRLYAEEVTYLEAVSDEGQGSS